jgi:hypothetical protein
MRINIPRFIRIRKNEIRLFFVHSDLFKHTILVLSHGRNLVGCILYTCDIIVVNFHISYITYQLLYVNECQEWLYGKLF